ncbi:MAG: hypothetical protein A3J47_04315 [Candidatus Yanofskybacteria bacterium RIFCSPHIGHO2_02_FULL_43_22]|uniref:Uncharacterized protein n=1 Tax=Candidatus Yanofskybacteria bacterium RIFCSPHIGHO2_02_FULL_43_22 TaxID=1802681 RepID=A0A1F8FNU4_9BACT|nr:MAG: hypothetical protein A3J47_04315 [Candidatus Yanofskybacteria bacterium RIFCSPHIGHO2_02_FULL_43_22]
MRVAKTTTITTLGPQVRLVVFKFLVRSELVPECIPRLPVNRSGGATPTVPGKMVLLSTPNVWLAGLRTGLLNTKGDYALVGARANDERGDDRGDVRFTFCHRRHLSGIPPHENFVEKFNELVNTFVDFTKSNLWAVQGYLNPYLLENGVPTSHSVLMLNCAGRKPAINPDGTPVMVFEGGREKPLMPGHIGQGIGPKISILNKASEMKLAGKKVQLVTP